MIVVKCTFKDTYLGEWVKRFVVKQLININNKNTKNYVKRGVMMTGSMMLNECSMEMLKIKAGNFW